MKSAIYRYSLIKRLAVATRPFGVATRLPHPCPVRPTKNRATPMAVDILPLHVHMDVDDPDLHQEMMDLDPWWEPFAYQSPPAEATACPQAMDCTPEQKGCPPPAPVLRLRLTPPPTSGRPNRSKLTPARARREAVPLVASSSIQKRAATVRAAGSFGRGMNRPKGAQVPHLRSSSQQLVATEMPPPNAPVKVDTLERLVRSAQSLPQKAPSPLGSPSLRPMGLVPPSQEGLTRVDLELLSQLEEIGSASNSPSLGPQLEIPTDQAEIQLQLDEISFWLDQLDAEDEKSSQAKREFDDVLGTQEKADLEGPLSAGP